MDAIQVGRASCKLRAAASLVGTATLHCAVPPLAPPPPRPPPQRSTLTWLMVGCTQPVRMAWMVAIASMPPAAPRQCPIMLLVPFILIWDRSLNTCGKERRGGGRGGSGTSHSIEVSECGVAAKPS